MVGFLIQKLIGGRKQLECAELVRQLKGKDCIMILLLFIIFMLEFGLVSILILY